MPVVILLRLLLTGRARAIDAVPFGPTDDRRRPHQNAIAADADADADAACGFSHITPGLRLRIAIAGLVRPFRRLSAGPADPFR